MATEEDRQEERDRLGNEPLHAPERSGSREIEEQLESANDYQAPLDDRGHEESAPADSTNDEPEDPDLRESQR